MYSGVVALALWWCILAMGHGMNIKLPFPSVLVVVAVVAVVVVVVVVAVAVAVAAVRQPRPSTVHLLLYVLPIPTTSPCLLCSITTITLCSTTADIRWGVSAVGGILVICGVWGINHGVIGREKPIQVTPLYPLILLYTLCDPPYPLI